MSYYTFIKEQSPEFQRDTLGKGNSERLTSGDLNSETIRKLKMKELFRPLTLAEMKERESLIIGD